MRATPSLQPWRLEGFAWVLSGPAGAGRILGGFLTRRFHLRLLTVLPSGHREQRSQHRATTHSLNTEASKEGLLL
jgi:hypothetical protein